MLNLSQNQDIHYMQGINKWVSLLANTF